MSARRSRRARVALAALVAALAAFVLARGRGGGGGGRVETASVVPAAHAQSGPRVVLWHSYRGDELAALERVIREASREIPGLQVDTLAVPFDAYASKLESAIPHGHGPDVFIDAHERLASYDARGILATADGAVATPEDRAAYDAVALAALTRAGHVWAVPLAVKTLVLYVNPALVGDAPLAAMEDVEALRARLPRDAYPLAYPAQSAYMHAAFAHAFGARMIDPVSGRFALDSEQGARAVEYVTDLQRRRIVPEEADGALVTQLFASGRAATAISGPWLAAELRDRVRYTVVEIPPFRARPGATRPTPYVTVEGAFVASRARDPALALRFARYLASPRAAVIRARVGRQVVATRAAWDDPSLARDAFLATFRRAADGGVPMPTHANMRASFGPVDQALRKVLRGDMAVRDALAQARHRFEDVTRPPPSRRDATLALLVLGVIAALFAFRAVQRAREPDFRAALRRSLPAYRYVAHAVVAVLLLVVAPLVVGAATSLFAGRQGASYYVGLANYWDILRARGGPLFASGSFYLVLGVTVLWTLANVFFHLAIGVALALLLDRPTLRMRGLYRVLLIIPWAVPSYVTALAWKGMFHRQFGAINAILRAVGVEPVAWFARFSTAFTANVATNVWLGFPFMMVVTLGALSAIPRDLYEAAAVDGATAWQRFWKITLPLLKPSLAPAVAMGAVWTFNMFNVIFLVSGGEPDGQTDILVTEAYRWAFTRQAQFGYAAAYAVLIFGILVVGTRALDRAASRVARQG